MGESPDDGIPGVNFGLGVQNAGLVCQCAVKSHTKVDWVIAVVQEYTIPTYV